MLTDSEAHTLAERAHGSDRMRTGSLFIDHVRRVAGRVDDDPDDYAVVAALLHDTVEKGSMEWSDLRRAGADQRLIEVVDALTERDGEAERAYLARCAADPLALRIKRADIADKLDVNNLVGLTGDVVATVQSRARQRLDLLESLASHVG